MIRPFLDANVLVTILNKEYPGFTDSARVMTLADRKGVQLYTSPLCLAIAWYFAGKKSGEKLAAEKIRLLMKKLSLAAVGEKEVRLCLEDKKVRDLEDGMEYYAAESAGCTHIVTYNTTDFHFARIPVCDPEVFLREIVGRKDLFS